LAGARYALLGEKSIEQLNERSSVLKWQPKARLIWR
jgi:hypothetical protein